MMWVIVIVAVIGIVILAVGALIATRPSEKVITRSATMNAPPERVHELVNHLQRWGEWSPWAKKDPDQRITFEGPEAGVGAAFSWVGNKEVGEGRIEIVESKPAECVKIRLDFIKPMKVTNTAAYTFEDYGAGTRVTWSMTCKSDQFMAKVFTLLVDMDKMIGADFEEGLAAMKALAEA
jgi:hypothetical protein